MPDTVQEIARHRLPDPLSVDPFVVGPIHLDGGGDDGVLSGLRFAVKNLYDVAGTRTGAGNPEFLREAKVASAHAPCVEMLIAAGAELVGKTVTDELAFSLSGTNIHYGTPRNPVAREELPGGSSSGSAAAVAGGLVDFSLGTDTGGSTRVPASYCGVFGLRGTHGQISHEGVFLLAPSFCSIGVFTRDAAILDQVWSILAGPRSASQMEVGRRAGRLLVVPELFDLADPGATGALLAAAERFAKKTGLSLVNCAHGLLGDPRSLFEAFRTIQMFEAWELHGNWVTEHRSALGWGIAARFDGASLVKGEAVVSARERRTRFQRDVAELMGSDGYLLQPAASGPAPAINLAGAEKDDLRLRTMMLTAPAGLAGSPVVSMPLTNFEGLPVGLAVVGLPGDDDKVIDLAARGAPTA